MHSSRFIWSDVQDVPELLDLDARFFLRRLGEAGKPDQLNLLGVDGRSVGIMLDGRPMNDPITGTYNLADMPLEFVDQIETAMDGDAFLGAPDGPAGSLNFVSKQYNTLRPQTKIRYVQDPFESLLTDGLFAQNVARSTNLMAAFQRRTSNGRFPNAGLDSWNIRSRLRYDPSDRWNIALSDFYTKALNGLNGGIAVSRSSSEFDELTASMNDTTASSTLYRRDVTLSSIAEIFPDTTWLTQASIYYSTIRLEYNDPGSLAGTHDVHRSSLTGIRIQQSVNPDFVSATGVFERDERKVLESRMVGPRDEAETDLSGRLAINAVDFFVPTFSGRFASTRGTSAVSSGGEISVRPLPSISINAGLSSTIRFPTIQEMYWTDSTVMRPSPISNERHDVLFAGMQFNADSMFTCNVSAFQRKIADAIVFAPTTTAYGTPAAVVLNVATVRIQGVSASAALSLGPFTLSESCTYLDYREADTTKSLFPKIQTTTELRYHNILLSNALEMNVGLRVRFVDRERGMMYLPQEFIYTENMQSELGGFTTFDLYGTFTLGSVYVTLSWQNISDADYLLTAVYPMPGRLVRLGINWLFLD